MVHNIYIVTFYEVCPKTSVLHTNALNTLYAILHINAILQTTKQGKNFCYRNHQTLATNLLWNRQN